MTWPIAPLRELTTKIGSGATPRGGRDSYKSDGIPLIRSMNVHDGIFLTKGMAYLDLEQAKSLDNVELETGDVLLNITGASVARVCRLPEQFKGGRVNQHVAIIRTKHTLLHPHFLEHFLICPETKAKLLSIATSGATREAITKSAIEDLCVPVPPLNEQRRIAAILDQADELRRLRQRAIDRLSQLGQSIFVELFGDLSLNDRGWSMAEVQDFVAGFESGKSLVADDEDENSQHRVLKVSAVTSLFYRPTESKPLPPNYIPPVSHIVRQGDLLFSRANTSQLIGATALVEQTPPSCVLSDKIWRFVWHDKPRADPFFVWHLFRQRRFRDAISSRATGTSGSMKNISQEKVLSIPIALPPLKLQNEFANRMRAVSAIRAETESAQLAQDALFASLQHRAFRGEL